MWIFSLLLCQYLLCDMKESLKLWKQSQTPLKILYRLSTCYKLMPFNLIDVLKIMVDNYLKQTKFNWFCFNKSTWRGRIATHTFVTVALDVPLYLLKRWYFLRPDHLLDVAQISQGEQSCSRWMSKSWLLC